MPTLIPVNGKPVSSCCQAEVERQCDYTDTHVFVVDGAEQDENGNIVSATYKFLKTYDGTDGVNVIFLCRKCLKEIDQDNIDWQEG